MAEGLTFDLARSAVVRPLRASLLPLTAAGASTAPAPTAVRFHPAVDYVLLLP